jgi:hypothetical protein
MKCNIRKIGIYSKEELVSPFYKKSKKWNADDADRADDHGSSCDRQCFVSDVEALHCNVSVMSIKLGQFPLVRAYLNDRERPYFVSGVFNTGRYHLYFTASSLKTIIITAVTE